MQRGLLLAVGCSQPRSTDARGGGGGVPTTAPTTSTTTTQQHKTTTTTTTTKHIIRNQLPLGPGLGSTCPKAACYCTAPRTGVRGALLTGWRGTVWHAPCPMPCLLEGRLLLIRVSPGGGGSPRSGGREWNVGPTAHHRSIEYPPQRSGQAPPDAIQSRGQVARHHSARSSSARLRNEPAPDVWAVHSVHPDEGVGLIRRV